MGRRQRLAGVAGARQTEPFFSFFSPHRLARSRLSNMNAVTKYLESIAGATSELLDGHRRMILDVIRNVEFEKRLYQEAFNHLRGNPHDPISVLEALAEAVKYGIISTLKVEGDPPEPNECPHCGDIGKPRTQLAFIEGEERETHFCESCNHSWEF